MPGEWVLHWDGALDPTTLEADGLMAVELRSFERRVSTVRWALTLVSAPVWAALTVRQDWSPLTGLLFFAATVPVVRGFAGVLLPFIPGMASPALGLAALTNSSLRPTQLERVTLRDVADGLVLEVGARTITLPWTSVTFATSNGLGVVIGTSERLGYAVPREAFTGPAPVSAEQMMAAEERRKAFIDFVNAAARAR